MLESVEDARDRRTLTLEEVTRMVGGRLQGDGATRVHGIRPVDEAGKGQIALLAGKKYVRYASTSNAEAFLVASEFEDSVPASVPRVVVDETHPALRTLLEHFHPPEPVPADVHQTAVIGRGVRLGKDVVVGPYVVIEDEVTVGDGSRIGAHTVIGKHSTIGAGCHLHPHVVVYHGSVIGSGVIVHAGAAIGKEGFGYTLVDGSHRKIPQVGRAVIGDDVEIGANTTIDRGSLGDTVVGQGVKIDNLVQVAHNVRIGKLSMLASLVGVAGSTRVGEGVWIGGQAGLINNLDIGDGARIAVRAGVLRDVPAGDTVSGYPARPHRKSMERQALVLRLPKFVDRLRRLEEQVERMKGDHGPDSEAI